MNERLRVQTEQIEELTRKNEHILDQLRRLKSTLQLHPGGYATPKGLSNGKGGANSGANPGWQRPTTRSMLNV